MARCNLDGRWQCGDRPCLEHEERISGKGPFDVLWRGDNGIIGEWLIGVGGSVNASNLAIVGADWHVAATGDVNGDTFDDVVWRNDNGAVGEWLMHGNAVAAQNLPTVDAVWMVSGHHFDFV